MFWIILAVVLFVFGTIICFIDIVDNHGFGISFLLIAIAIALFILTVVPGGSVQEEDLIKDKNRVSELIVITNATVTKVERVKRIAELMDTIEMYNKNLALCGKNNKNKDNMFYIHFSNFDVSKYEFLDLEKIIEELKGE